MSNWGLGFNIKARAHALGTLLHRAWQTDNERRLQAIQAGKGVGSAGASAVRAVFISIAPKGVWLDIGSGAGEYGDATNFFKPPRCDVSQEEVVRVCRLTGVMQTLNAIEFQAAGQALFFAKHGNPRKHKWLAWGTRPRGCPHDHISGEEHVYRIYTI